MVSEFAKRHGIRLVEEYADDGYTGTNFNRPAFGRLMEDAQAGKVNCVIVKDLSRLGRNYIEMGRFISSVFPSLGIRLIAMNDAFDSFDESNSSNQIVVPFKNLINDAYCRDMSLKIRSQLDLKRRKGKFIGSFATYGYAKDENDRNRLVPDEEAAKVVEMIFNMKMDGYGTKHVIDRLNEMHVPTPLQYKRMRGQNYNSGFRGTLEPKWTATTVNRILRNEIYAGVMIQGKRRKINYKIKKVIDVNERDWVRVENTHEPIVPRETFLAVQRLLNDDVRTSPKEENVYVLSGIVKCADCGQNMVRRMSGRNGKKYYYYYCSSYKHDKTCTPHNLSEAKLYDAVLVSVKSVLSNLAKANELLLEMEERPHDVIGVSILNKQMEEQVREINRYGDLKVQLYMDMTDGIVSREEFKDLNGTFTAKIDGLRHALRKNEKKKEKKLALNVRDVPWISEFLEFGNVQRLDRRIATCLIERVTVYDGGRVEVTFRHGEELEEIIKVAETAREGKE
jgi:DNA invertase Pin-like site-specific DNA recombinase